MQTWTDEALRALLCEELEAASYPVRRKQLIERSAARLGERVESRADLRPGSAWCRGRCAVCRPRGCAISCWRS